MLKTEVQVYFVDNKVFSDIKNSSDHGYNIIKNLISENKKLEVNAKNLDFEA